MYEGLHHVSVVVTDLDKAKHFYGEVLGLKESKERPNFDFPGAWYDIGSTQIHLIVHSGAKTLRNTQQIDTRDGHLAIRVKDMTPILNRLDEQGWTYYNNPHSITGWHQVFVADPDGNMIEFNL